MEPDFDLHPDGNAEGVTGMSGFAPGPRSLKDVFLWADYFLDRLQQNDLLQNVTIKASSGGINLMTDWSGMGMPECSFNMLNEAFEYRGLPKFPTECIRACDNDPLCRRVLCSYTAGRPKHIFKDIQERISPDLLSKLKRMTKEVQEQVRTQRKNNKMDLDLRDRLGEQLVFNMCNMLKEVNFAEMHNDCVVHGKQCPIWGDPMDSLPGGLDCAIVGNECLDWSSIGSRLEFCGDGLVTFLIWCFETLARRPAIIIEECTPHFKAWVLQHVFCTLGDEGYTMETRLMSPTDVGIPVARVRQWCILLDKRKLRPVMSFSGSEFSSMFFRNTVLDGSLFFKECGGPNERMNFKRMLLRQRGVFWGQGRNVLAHQKKNTAFLSAGNRARLLGYKKLAHRRGITSGIVDITQNSGHKKNISVVMPTLLRRSLMVELECEELLLPSVHFDVMGIPLHHPPGVYHKCVFSNILRGLSDCDMRRLCGNSMHASMIGLCIIYVLGCTTLVD